MPVAADNPPRNASAASGSLSNVMGSRSTNASGGASPPNFNRPAAAMGMTKMTKPRKVEGKEPAGIVAITLLIGRLNERYEIVEADK